MGWGEMKWDGMGQSDMEWNGMEWSGMNKSGVGGGWNEDNEVRGMKGMNGVRRENGMDIEE